ncbi:CPBP family intramembrane glutamic endopeptidase [Isoptericola croceus]|uniref:CPBP family intramembrane glutamic endopeptidase n=1 Tax=Isoptericola croceus TaxID=3031406 RepID=UPI0023F6D96C|nr:type II CAAX endopeptidase family protein [Isoptericola croceus]
MTTATPTPTAPAPAAGQVPPGVEYHRVLAGEERRIGRGVLAILLLIGGLFGAIQVFFLLAEWIDGLIRPDTAPDVPGYTALTLGSGLFATALLIPWSMFIQRWLYGVRGPSLHSVVSRFRFDLFGRALLGVFPLFLIAFAITEYLEPRATVVWSHADIITLFVVVMLLVPLQAAGEEYGLRGLVFRVAGSWARGPRASLILGIAVSGAVFAVIHTAADPWWNVIYALFSVSTGLVTWRTGGLEIAVVMHAALNLVVFLFWFVLQADLADRFDRSAGAVTPALLVPLSLVIIAVAVVVWLRTRRSGPAVTPAA